MLIDVKDVKPLSNKRLLLRFEDGVEGVVDIAAYLKEFTGVFEPLKEDAYFNQVAVSEELGTIYWPNGADLCSDVLYALAKGEPIPDLSAQGGQAAC